MLRTPLLVACSLAATALVACSVDDRALQAAFDPNGGTSAGGGGDESGAGKPASNGGSGSAEAGAAGANSANLPGDGGAAGTPNAPVQTPISTSGNCADLDEDKVPDCMQSLLSNADFDSNVSKWNAETGASLTWDPRDALNQSGSGAALLTTASGTVDTSGSSSVAASQCLAVTGGNIVAAFANVFVDADQGGAGLASVDVDFFDAANCMGTATPGFSTPQPLDATAGTWLTLKAALLTTPGTHSAKVKLTIAKQFQAGSFHARFDNVLLKQIAAK